MKKGFAVVVASLLMMVSLAGCGYAEGGSVSTDGSTSMEKVIGVLGESFMEANADVNFTYNPTGSSAGITAALEGTCDIGLSSRYLKEEEKEQGRWKPFWPMTASPSSCIPTTPWRT